MTTVKNNLDDTYDFKVVVVHWLSAFFMLSLIPTGKILRGTDVSFIKMALYQYHISIGLTVLLLTFYRIYLYFTVKRPAPLETGLIWHNRFIVWTRYAFYWALLILGFSGIGVLLEEPQLRSALYNVNWKGLPPSVTTEVFEAHEIFANLMIVLLVFHVGGVAVHYIRFKENTLKRIFF